MADLRLFRVGESPAQEVAGAAVELERHLQTMIERNMVAMLGVRFLATEYSTGPVHGGRIDSLGLDMDGSPVVVEYKRLKGENILNQALFYLAWLRDHQAEFEALVARKLGSEVADEVDWSNPRIICVAADYSRYDVHAIGEMSRRIDLVRYTRFGDDLLALQLHAAVGGASSAVPRALSPGRPVGNAERKTVRQALDQAQPELQALYADLDARLLSLGTAHSAELRQYIAYRHTPRANFASVKVLAGVGALLVYLRLDPSTVELVDGFTRDVTDVGHHGAGSLEVRITSEADLDRAARLLQASYDAA